MAIANMGAVYMGDDGVSPVVELNRNDSSVTLRITDAEGTKEAEIYDGEDGTNGDNGADGVSPVVEFTRGDGFTTLSITDAEGTKTTDIPDGATGPAGEPGKDNLPNVTAIAGTELALTLAHNEEYQCTEALTALTIEGFTAAEDGKVSMWALQFTAGEGITVTVPDTVKWAVADPVFIAGVTYWLSFVPLITGEILGVWVSNE